MTVTIKLFAILRDKAGVAAIALELPEGATVSSAVAILLERRPELTNWISRAAYAVNLARADSAAPLHNGDELALLPPVSGGC